MKRSPVKYSPKRQKKDPLSVGIANVKGGGIRIALNRNDKYDPGESIVETVINCKNPESNYQGLFYGYKHHQKIKLEEVEYDNFSYRWLKGDDEGKTCDDLLALLKQVGQFKKDPSKPYQAGNIHVQLRVHNNGDPIAMNGFYSDRDIIQHCIDPKDRFAMWREEEKWTSQPADFYFENPSQHETLKDMIANYKQQQYAAPAGL